MVEVEENAAGEIEDVVVIEDAVEADTSADAAEPDAAEPETAA